MCHRLSKAQLDARKKRRAKSKRERQKWRIDRKKIIAFWPNITDLSLPSCGVDYASTTGA